MTMIAERPEVETPQPPEVANAKLLERAQAALDAHREGRLTFGSTWGVWDRRPDGRLTLSGCALAALMVADGPIGFSPYASGTSVLDALARDGVPLPEAEMIEASFEGFGGDGLTESARAVARTFYEAFPWYDKEARGLAVMRNIVAHGGRFDPSAPPMTG